MKYLLDTHVWLWMLDDAPRMGAAAKRALSRSGIALCLSPVSLWEVLLLVQRGRLGLKGPVEPWIAEALGRMPCTELPVNHAVALQSRALPGVHEDPADRFLVATALVHDLTLVTADDRILRSKACKLLPA